MFLIDDWIDLPIAGFGEPGLHAGPELKFKRVSSRQTACQPFGWLAGILSVSFLCGWP